MDIQTLDELKVSPIRDSVATALRKAFSKGQFRPGEDLSEFDLASKLKVSRGPVREALLILAKEGLVSHAHNRGFAVVELSEQDAKEIQAVRFPLELLALELARPHASEESLASLGKLIEKLRLAVRESDHGAVAEHDLAFHKKVYEMSGNRWLGLALERLIVPFMILGSVFVYPDPPEREEIVAAQHQAYVDYLRGDDARSAEECVRLHLPLQDPKRR